MSATPIGSRYLSLHCLPCTPRLRPGFFYDQIVGVFIARRSSVPMHKEDHASYHKDNDALLGGLVVARDDIAGLHLAFAFLSKLA